MSIRGDSTWQGMNWCRKDKRLAIYLRDGCACVWCGATVEGGAKLTLDHVTGYEKTQDNHESNLVTACHRCNTSRGQRTVGKFAVAVAAYLNSGIKSEEILKHVRRCASRSLTPYRKQAKELIALRGSIYAALQERN